MNKYITHSKPTSRVGGGESSGRASSGSEYGELHHGVICRKSALKCGSEALRKCMDTVRKLQVVTQGKRQHRTPACRFNSLTSKKFKLRKSFSKVRTDSMTLVHVFPTRDVFCILDINHDEARCPRCRCRLCRCFRPCLQR